MGIYQLGVVADYILEGGHGKVAENLSHFPFCRLQINVSLKLPFAIHRQTRVGRINLARMDVEDHRTAFR
jgi:hypothetical protein